MPIEAQRLMCGGETLPQICLDVHMAATGSSDPLDAETAARYGDILRLARDKWTPPTMASRDFDNAVLALVCAAIADTENYNG